MPEQHDQNFIEQNTRTSSKKRTEFQEVLPPEPLSNRVHISLRLPTTFTQCNLVPQAPLNTILLAWNSLTYNYQWSVKVYYWEPLLPLHIIYLSSASLSNFHNFVQENFGSSNHTATKPLSNSSLFSFLILVMLIFLLLKLSLVIPPSGRSNAVILLNDKWTSS